MSNNLDTDVLEWIRAIASPRSGATETCTKQTPKKMMLITDINASGNMVKYKKLTWTIFLLFWIGPFNGMVFATTTSSMQEAVMRSLAGPENRPCEANAKTRVATFTHEGRNKVKR